MKRLFLILGIALLMLVSAGIQVQAADIFGLKRGMSVSEVRALGFGNFEPFPGGEFGYFVENPKKPIVPDGATFIFFYFPPPSQVLLKVAFRFKVETKSYGVELRKKYMMLRDILQNKYGQGKESDYLRPEAEGAYTLSSFYVQGLVEGVRVLGWQKIDFALDNKWQLENLIVRAVADNIDDVSLYVVYEFNGWSSYLAKQKSEF